LFFKIHYVPEIPDKDESLTFRIYPNFEKSKSVYFEANEVVAAFPFLASALLPVNDAKEPQPASPPEPEPAQSVPLPNNPDGGQVSDEPAQVEIDNVVLSAWETAIAVIEQKGLPKGYKRLPGAIKAYIDVTFRGIKKKVIKNEGNNNLDLDLKEAVNKYIPFMLQKFSGRLVDIRSP
jgi:hypothetical protein